MGARRLKKTVDLAKWLIPGGFEVRISIQHGHVDVTLWEENGNFFSLPDTGSSLAEQVATAVLEACGISHR
jgi:hypothetical protein